MRSSKTQLIALLGTLCIQWSACQAGHAEPAGEPSPEVSRKARGAAQRGLGYLATTASKWTADHQCFGCHVQAVTLEGFAVGLHNQYAVAQKDLDTMLAAMRLGVTAGGHRTGVAFQGAAWARYDQWVKSDATDQLIRYARELVDFQRPDGSVEDDDRRPPVVAGTIQTTYQALQTWRQTYVRTADDLWLRPMRQAESYLAGVSGQWQPDPARSLLDLNYALMGLITAGAKAGETSAARLSKQVCERQRQDGGWGLSASASDAFGTGQSLYALKLAGYSDDHPVIVRGTRWLIDHQRQDGGWGTVVSGQGGADKGEAMWAVLGLVSVDVMSMSVAGLTDGQRVDDPLTIRVGAKNNQGKAIARLALLLDDRPLAETRGAKLEYLWKPKGLADGKHVLDVVATEEGGKTARQRYEVYAGNVYLTDVAAAFDGRTQASDVSLRSLAPKDAAGKVELEVYAVGPLGRPALDKKLFSTSQAAAPGALSMQWHGQASDGKPQPRGRYYAQVIYRDKTGKELQKQGVLFFHDSEAAQHDKFGEVEGRVQLKAGSGGAASNTEVQLLDDNGAVVQSTRTTDQGNYRFKNVDRGHYHVRVRKDGFADRLSGEVRPEPARAPAKASLSLD